jgi:ubiquinone/menaquinone biosynthesis C-methylase UbiE
MRAEQADIPFLNYGWLPTGSSWVPTLLPSDEPHATGIHLYQRVVEGVDLRGKDVLEVSSGHGGGASYVQRYLGPRSVVAIDRNPVAIKFARQRYANSGVSFRCADASALPFRSGSLNAVINVEASHGYPDAMRFFEEVRRVLRPEGHFLFADFRFAEECGQLQRDLLATGLQLVIKEDITEGVVRALDATTDRNRAKIRRWAAPWMRHAVEEFAGVAGSRMYEGFKTGGIVYLRYVLERR